MTARVGERCRGRPRQILEGPLGFPSPPPPRAGSGGGKILKLACGYPLLSVGSPLPALKADNTLRFLSGEALSGDGQGHPRSGTACPGGPLESCARDLAVSPAWPTQEPAHCWSLAGTATCSAGTERRVLYYSHGRATAPGLQAPEGQEAVL